MVRRTIRTGLGDGSRPPRLVANRVVDVSFAFFSVECFILDALGVPPDCARLDPLTLAVRRTIATGSGDTFCPAAPLGVASRGVLGALIFF